MVKERKGTIHTRREGERERERERERREIYERSMILQKKNGGDRSSENRGVEVMEEE